LSTFGHLPSITIANGFKVSSHSVGTIHLFPSLPIDNVLYVRGSLFNLLSINRLSRFLDCVVSFTKDFACLQDWSLGTGCESHGICYLRTNAHVGTVMDSPSLLHAQLSSQNVATCSKFIQVVQFILRVVSFRKT